MLGKETHYLVKSTPTNMQLFKYKQTKKYMSNIAINTLSILIAVPVTVYWYIKDTKQAQKQTTKTENKK
jgi:predicted nucleic acid binding AN1-type Zn finger protein